MLEATLQSEFVPATNLRGDLAGGAWMLLLPRLDLDQITCLGPPAPATLERLAQLAGEVIVVCRTHGQFARVRSIAAGSHPIRAVFTTDFSQLDAPESGIDLVLITDTHALSRAASDSRFASRIRRWLKPEGVIFAEASGWRGTSALRKLETRLAGDGFSTTPAWLTPARGEVQTAVRPGDEPAVRFLVNRGLLGKGTPGLDRRTRLVRVALSAWRRIHQSGAAWLRSPRGPAMTRQAILASAAADVSEGPPRYLREIARAAGLDLDHHRWAFTALGQYSSQKLVWYLFDPTDDPSARPAFVVKMPRVPEHNDRLERERDALVSLEELGFGDSETLPRVAFAGRHGGLAVVGETAMHGAPFEKQSDFTPECPHVRGALEWFTRLGEETADRAALDPAQVATRLEQLLRRFGERYSFSRDVQRFLARQIDVIGSSTEPFPLVFQHGDAGCWNLLVTGGGRVAVLDWESAETGLPLWDLFYLFRSVVSRAARRRSRFARRGRQRRLFLDDAGYGDLLVAAVGQYCQLVGLPPSLVEPLFHTCWMHRALKEATRLTPERLPSGREHRWLALCIRGRDAPTLRRIFSLQSSAPSAARECVCS